MTSETTGTDKPPRRGLRALFALVPLILFVALAAIFLGQLLSGRDTGAIPSALVGAKAPALDLPPLEGLSRDGTPVPGLSNRTIEGRLTLVNVWASWCVPCRQEHPVLSALAADPRFQIVGINYKDQPGNALRFLGELGNPYAAVGTDASGRTAIDWGVYGVPETYLVAADGMILMKHVGPLHPDAVRTTLLPAVEKAAGGR